VVVLLLFAFYFGYLIEGFCSRCPYHQLLLRDGFEASLAQQMFLGHGESLIADTISAAHVPN
jgi:hypothetical protein